MEKLVRDGKVAVIIGSGYGENWSTYATGKSNEEAVFCPRLALAVLGESGETVDEVSRELFPNLREFSTPRLQVEWVPVGVKFFIIEEDGKETLWREDEISWTTA